MINNEYKYFYIRFANTKISSRYVFCVGITDDLDKVDNEYYGKYINYLNGVTDFSQIYNTNTFGYLSINEETDRMKRYSLSCLSILSTAICNDTLTKYLGKPDKLYKELSVSDMVQYTKIVVLNRLHTTADNENIKYMNRYNPNMFLSARLRSNVYYAQKASPAYDEEWFITSNLYRSLRLFIPSIGRNVINHYLDHKSLNSNYIS